MSRSIGAAVQTALEAANVPLLVFVELDFSGGFVRVTNAPYDFDWNGHTWTGLGRLGGIDAVQEGASLEARGVALKLAGVPISGEGDAENIAIALNEHYQGRDARVWVAPLQGDSEQEDYLEFNFLEGTLAPKNGEATITFTRAGATATRVNGSGDIETVAADTARFDYDPATLECKGLLIEEARSNLATRSSELDLFGGNLEVVITPDVVVAPDGTLSGDRMTDTSGNNVHQVSKQFATVTDGQTLVASAWAKAGTLSYISFGITRRDGSVPSVWFNVADGTIGTTNSGITASIEAYPNGWYRCVAIVPILTGASTPLVRYRIASADGITGYIGSGGDVYYWGMQVEVGAFATSYIPTTSAAATRNADVATVSSISGFFNAAEGTIAVEAIAPNHTVASLFEKAATFSDGTGNNLIDVGRSSGVARAFVIAGSVTYANTSMAAWTAGTVGRLVHAYKTNDQAASFNGGTAVADTAVTLPAVDRLHLGANAAASPTWNGHLRRFKYIPQRRPNTDLVALSADFDAELDLVRNPFAILADPKLVFLGRMDNMQIEAGRTATITLQAESRLADLERPRVRRYNDADQQLQYPGDRGLEFAEQMVERNLLWGRSR